MSHLPLDRDIEAATEKLADNPALILDCILHDAFWKDLVSNCYADCIELREWFALYYAERINTDALQLAAERAQEAAEWAADDARWEQEKAA